MNSAATTKLLEEDRLQAPSGCEVICDFAIAENQCEVLGNEWVNSEYRHLALKAPPIALTVLPGQFFHLACPPSHAESPYLRRPMSLYRVNSELAQIEFLYKVQGAGTRGLASLKVGETLNAMGPLGSGFKLPEPCDHVLVLARGVGLATMAPLAEYARRREAQVTAILSARAPGVVMSADYLSQVGAKVIIVTDTDRSSEVTNVEALVRHAHAERPFGLLATCGSNRLLQLVQKLGSELRINSQTALEQHMGCGLGMCYACVKPFRKDPGSSVLSYRRVCWEGPVFDVQETVSWST